MASVITSIFWKDGTSMIAANMFHVVHHFSITRTASLGTMRGHTRLQAEDFVGCGLAPHYVTFQSSSWWYNTILW
jgi:hypothetical protein